MNTKQLLLWICFLTSFFCCDAQKKMKYTFPDDIADTAKKDFVKQFYQGMTLYKISCGKCHNKLIDGKELIPNFSLPQLMDYEIRIFPEHNGKLTDNKVTDDELPKIILFLRYKEKNKIRTK